MNSSFTSKSPRARRKRDNFLLSQTLSAAQMQSLMLLGNKSSTFFEDKPSNSIMSDLTMEEIEVVGGREERDKCRQDAASKDAYEVDSPRPRPCRGRG